MPVGVPVPGAAALTVAVNVTGWPYTEGFADEMTEVVVLSSLTTSVTDEEPDPLKFASPT